MMRGREVEFLEVRQRIGAHTECALAFARDPKAVASSVALLRLAELAGASVRVVFTVDGTQEYLAFAGTVRDAEIEHLASGAGEVSITALSDSYVLDEHVDRRYFREHGPAALAQALGLGVSGTLPAGEVRDYVQAGVSAWTFLNQVASGEGLQLRPVWPRTPDGSAEHPAEIGKGFGEEMHVLTWGRELIRLATSLAPVNAGVTGAFYEPGTKHDHRFHGVRATVGWLGGAKPVVSAAQSIATSDADGGDPGHVEVGWTAGTRARTLTEFRTRMELASARRLGSAVRARGVSVSPALRAGDQIRVDEAPGIVPTSGEAAGPGPLDEHVGTFGLVQVTHRWTGTLYENHFEATPWAAFHLAPNAASFRGEQGAPQSIALGVVTSVTDPKGMGRIKVRYGWMDEGEATHWVRVAGLGGGNGRGVGVLPSVGDEVVVAAVGGDPEHPVVLGALWSGVDRAGHAPGRQHWVTPAGNTLSFVEGKAGADEEKVELYSRTGACWVQLAAKGPTGVPTVTVHSEGDLAIEAPKGELRITAKSMTTFVETDVKREVKGAVHDTITGPVTIVSQAQLALRGSTTMVVADGALRAHAGSTTTVTGQLVTLNPNGSAAPQVTAQPPEKKPSAWGARPIPGPGPGRSTQDPRTPTQRELAKKAQAVSMIAAPVAAAAVVPAVAAGSNLLAAATGAEPTDLAAKMQRLTARRGLVQGARDQAAGMPPGAERDQLLATATRFEDDTHAVDRARLAQHTYDYFSPDVANKAPPVGFEQITSPEELSRYGLEPSDLAPADSDFRAILYRSQLDDSGKPILAFRGTTSGEDWKNNFQQGVGMESKYYKDALSIGAKLGRATADTGGFETVGHSLGGGLASAVSAKEQVLGTIFNSSGVSETTLNRVNATRADADGLIKSYQVQGEPLTAVQDRTNQRVALGVVGLLTSPLGAGVAGVAREALGERILPTALGVARTIPAVDAPEYQGFLGSLNPMKYVKRHFASTVISGFEQEKSQDAQSLGAPALR